MEKVFEIKGHVDSKGAPGGGAGAITTSGMFTMIGARVFFHMLPREGRLVEEVEKRFETSGKRGLKWSIWIFFVGCNTSSKQHKIDGMLVGSGLLRLKGLVVNQVQIPKSA